MTPGDLRSGRTNSAEHQSYYLRPDQGPMKVEGEDANIRRLSGLKAQDGRVEKLYADLSLKNGAVEGREVLIRLTDHTVALPFTLRYLTQISDLDLVRTHGSEGWSNWPIVSTAFSFYRFLGSFWQIVMVP